MSPAELPPAFEGIRGQKTAIETLARALSAGRVHHAYRFEGPEGVGKELVAMALARALVCESTEVRGCGLCSACHRALTWNTSAPIVPVHPDIVIVGRGVYPKSLLGREETTGISVEQVRRVILTRTGMPPHEGRALVIIIRDAHELGISAANALLKTLEEPHPQTFFVLLTSQPNLLIDTVRSRTLPLRFRPLSDELIQALLQAQGLRTDVVPLAHGSASLAFELATAENLGQYESFAEGALKGLAAKTLAHALDAAADRPNDRDQFLARLDFLGEKLAALGRSAVNEDLSRAEAAASAHAVVLQAMGRVKANMQPALAFEWMMAKLRECGPAPLA
ncbi:MAG: DNA polymerase III subunit delta' [Polyangiaceae bacterium]|nr:DNA polymerase III subunit delta' [Polyangiaceae bacterium]